MPRQRESLHLFCTTGDRIVSENLCKNCEWRRESSKDCVNPKLRERGDDDEDENDCLTYSYEEGGMFYVGDNFGCVHFKSR